MAITRAKKEERVQEITDAVKDAGSVAFVSFNKLTVAETSAMRRVLRAAGAHYVVAKKTLAARAFTALGFEGTLPELPGEFAFIYGEDMIAPAREVNEFVKKNKDKLSIVGGIFEGRFMDASEMQSIATIPPLKTLYAQFVMLINSPLQGLVVALDQIAEKKA
jgi:large subunit ribosomal protein L10